MLYSFGKATKSLRNDIVDDDVVIKSAEPVTSQPL